MNQLIGIRIKFKVHSATYKVPSTKLLAKVIQEHNNTHTHHSVIKFPPANLLFAQLPSNSHLKQNCYPPANKALKVAKTRTLKKCIFV